MTGLRRPLRSSWLIVVFVLLAVASPASAQQCVDLNTASSEELRRIIHVDVVRAREIVRLRDERRFASVDDVVRVRGIAAGRLRDIKAQGLACVRSRRVEVAAHHVRR